MLRESGHDVTCVKDGQELLDLILPTIGHTPDSKSFDLIVTDITMPRVDGCEAASIIRELEGSMTVINPIPIVAITAHVLPEEQGKILAKGVNRVVTKPVSPDKISEAISDLFN